MEVFAGMKFKARDISLPRFASLPILLALVVLFASNIVAPAARAQGSVVEFDPAQTEITFTLSDVLHTVHGIFKLESGKIRFDPATGKASGAIIVDATSGESGNGSRDRKMHREILESGKYAQIAFTPSQVKGTLALHGSFQMEVSGQFRMHGNDHDLTVPIEVQADGQRLEIKAHFTVPYVLWGLKNPSTFLLRVSDKAAIDIHAVGHVASP
jgi:polyisoprenoid-binding protein YceI